MCMVPENLMDEDPAGLKAPYPSSVGMLCQPLEYSPDTFPMSVNKDEGGDRGASGKLTRVTS